MSDALTVSVVIVSRQRPEALRRCLTGVAQLMYHRFEVVVVADPDSCTAMRDLPQAAHARLVACDTANVSAARNVGIESAAGEIVAFIDDISVPEPTWLHYLIAPFARQEVVAAGGFVRGRNGISFRNKAEWVDRTGKTGPIELAGEGSVMFSATADRAIRTVATNMAVRRSVLADIGGFDPVFRTGLGDTDLNLRLADLGHCTAIAPLAQVHRGANDVRRAKGVARDLSDLGESWAVFLRKHCDEARLPDLLRRLKADQRRRALTRMIDGRLEPRDVRRLMESFERGWRAGLARERALMPRLAHPKEAFRPFVWQKLGPPSVLSGRFWSRSRLRAQALAKNGSVTVIRLSPTGLFHKVRFTNDGYWEQTGGMFGKSERTQPLISFWTFGRRVRSEIDRIREVRGLQ
ncbi:glycosyltransferase [Sedimentitalea sp. JM2-8]|uniref:Glycosyltransferase n=1 Tax=Sedimentitalea xiamensis TaxID=3050037 RepID=A0ABT7F9E0_9RHOB|nr:glycosyltransferase [Sedimentitalea xiamensis]MDK3071719.1 glycosyltransferase [Sedimentitalea xiamensis]